MAHVDAVTNTLIPVDPLDLVDHQEELSLDLYPVHQADLETLENQDVMVKMVTLVGMAARVQMVILDHQDPLAQQDPPEKLDMALLDPRVVWDIQVTQELAVTQAGKAPMDLKDTLDLMDQ